MKKQYKIMFEFIKRVFIVLLSLSRSLVTKCISLKNQRCIARPKLIDLNPDELNQELHYYPLVYKLDRYIGSCSTLNNLFDKKCRPNKTKEVI